MLVVKDPVIGSLLLLMWPQLCRHFPKRPSVGSWEPSCGCGDTVVRLFLDPLLPCSSASSRLSLASSLGFFAHDVLLRILVSIALVQARIALPCNT